jgi:putative transposase
VLLRRPRPARLSWLAARSAGARTLRTARLRPDDQSRASAADAGTSRSRAADYRWSSYRANALGASDALLSPHALYLALSADDDARRAAYRELFRATLDEKPLSNLRLALKQDQPIGNDRFYREIEAMTGQRRVVRRRGRPRKRDEEASAGDPGQGELPL